MNDRIKKHPIAAFYILAFFFTWLAWIPQTLYSYGLFPFDHFLFYIIGGMGPLAAALIVAHALYGKKDGEVVFSPLLKWRVGIIWYILAVGLNLFILFASVMLRGELTIGIQRISPSFAMLTSFLSYLVAAIPEEIAWRGFVLPRLQAKYSALVSTLIISVLWSLWHLPLLLNKSNVMSTYALLPYFLDIIAGAIIYTWLYNSSGGSVLIVTIYHTVSNVLGPNLGTAQCAVDLIIAIIIIVVFGHANLSRKKRQTISLQE